MNITPWRKLSANQLDWAYDQTQHAHNMREVLTRCADKSAAFWARGVRPVQLAYGPSAVETVHWYRSHTTNAPVVFLIHGGAWRAGRAQDYAFGVEWLLAAGVDVVIPDFASVIDTQGQLLPMASQLQQALAFVAKQSSAMQCDASPIHVCGHSSGAHLAACLPTLDWSTMGFDKAPIASLLCCSGLFDLEPVSHSSRSSYVSFDAACLAQLSPVQHIKAFDMPVRVLCGTQESPEFMRQSFEFHALLAQHHANAELHWGEGLNHFEILETLETAEGFFGKALLLLAEHI